MAEPPSIEIDRARALGLAPDVARLAPLPAQARAELAAGGLGFLEVPLDPGSAASVRAWGAAAPEADDVVVAGMGGSALSARVFAALRPMDATQPRLHVLDTVDPWLVRRLLGALVPERTLVVAVSKSGTTLETGAVFGVLEAWLRAALGDAAAAHIAIVSGVEANPFRAHAEAQGYGSFDVPAGVGGRYSGLTAVGLLPASLVGVDPAALLAGAAAARALCLADDLEANPALLLAGLHQAALASGRGVSVLWPYGERLAPLGPWWAQLVGESLGKPGPEGPTGVTPLAARGPADQHSLLQLLVEGPDDKLTVFVGSPPSVSSDGPRVPVSADGYSAAAGHGLGDVLHAEQEATAFALARAGRPSISVRLADAGAHAVGAFLLTYEMAVVYWSRLLGVDPFGQPGVGLGKRAALARLKGEDLR